MLPWQLMRGHLRGQKNSKPQASCHRAFQIVVATYADQKHLTINWNMCPNFIYLLWQLCDSYFPSLWVFPSLWSASQGFQGRLSSVLLGQEAGESSAPWRLTWNPLEGSEAALTCECVNWCKNLDVSTHSANLITFSPFRPPAPCSPFP